MIELQSLTKDDIGKFVLFSDGIKPIKRGRLKSWGAVGIFAVFNCNNQWENYQSYTAESCNPEHLTFELFEEK